MKQCPKCGSTYTDDGLRFCLTDGTGLIAATDEQATLVAGRGATVPYDISLGRRDPLSAGQSTLVRRSSVGKTLAAAGVLGVFLIIAVIAFVLVIYVVMSRSKTGDNGNVNKNASAVPTASPTPDAEKQRLENELANIQKRLDNQQKGVTGTPTPPPTPNSPGAATARVNSPNDGFLALRVQPDANSKLVVKIPHGDAVTIENCNRNKVSIGGRTGRWCLVAWNGNEGYVFDAWLIY